MFLFPIPPGASPHSNAYFGEGQGPINLDSVVCSGSEYNLTECSIGNSGSSSSHSMDVGVKCQPGTVRHTYNSYVSHTESYVKLVYTLKISHFVSSSVATVLHCNLHPWSRSLIWLVGLSYKKYESYVS